MCSCKPGVAMTEWTDQWVGQCAERAKLEGAIKKNLAGLGFDVAPAPEEDTAK